MRVTYSSSLNFIRLLVSYGTVIDQICWPRDADFDLWTVLFLLYFMVTT